MSNEGSCKKFAVTNRRCRLNLHIDLDISNDVFKYEGISVEAGTLIKILRRHSEKSGQYIVQVVDSFENKAVYENIYDCGRSNILIVDDDLWPFLISIPNAQQRLELVKNAEQCQFILGLKCNDFVSVTGELFKKHSTAFSCIVRYIGPVYELAPVGFFFGLELLNLEAGKSPQATEITFAFKYVTVDPTLAIITTADWLRPIGETKKNSTLEFFNETLDKVRNVIAPTSTYDSLRKPKKLKTTAQFYDTADTVTSVATAPNDEETTNTMESNKRQNLHKTVNDATKSKHHYDNKSLQVNAPPGILKHRSTTSSLEDATTCKSNPRMHLNDKDIIVIDDKDIQESTKSESSVIIVNNPSKKDVDLVDLLGKNWPDSAGDAGAMLNKKLPQQQQFATNKNAIENNQNGECQLKESLKDSSFTSKHNVATQAEKQSILKDSFTSSAEAANANDGKENIAERSSSLEHAKNTVNYVTIEEIPDTALGQGSMVLVSVSEITKDMYGVIRWIGYETETQNIVVGVELEEDYSIEKTIFTSDGTYNGNRYFKCQEGRAVFVNANQCCIDQRFVETDGENSKVKTNRTRNAESIMFGQVECPAVPGAVAPIKVFDSKELEDVCGKHKGIQGHHNSCYLDATLFSMFTFTSVFDSLLFRPADKDDISHYTYVQKVLREEIVNPLRKNIFVRADKVMKLRQLLDKLSSVSGLTSEEKDPEEFLNSLLSQIMRAEPFLKLSSGQDAYFYQLFIEKDERLTFPSVQQLFEQSFHSSDIKLKEVPACLIIQMPRFGKNYKMYPRILPSQVLDITDIIEDSPRQCSVCGKLAEFECQDCFGTLQVGSGLESTSFCPSCLETVHMHAKRSNHTSKKISIPQDFKNIAEHMSVPRLYMELFAVVCIETSHYVAFVKAGSGPYAPWCFFDSMADRKGEQNGYNIPEMIVVPDLPSWLSEDGARLVNETSSNDKMLPEHAKRLFCDAYMCMYQSTDVMMYR